MRSQLVAWLFASCTCWAQQPALIGYYAGDGESLAGHRIDHLTHLIWCFGHLQNDSMVIADSQRAVLERMVAFKKDNPELKVLVSLGGWGGCAPCSEAFSRADGRRTFAQSVLALLEYYRADGIDLDWEYPAVAGFPDHRFAPEDRLNFTLLVEEIRKVLGAAYEITFAAGGTRECLEQGFEWDRIMPLVDRVHIMSYDLVHGYSTRTGHHTALFGTTQQALSADGAVRLLDSLGVPRSQVVIGSAFYTRYWKDVPDVNAGLYQPGTFSHTSMHRGMDTTIVESNGWRIHWDDTAKAPYAYHKEQRLFASYDDQASVAAKARYVRLEGLGGIMFWQLHDDRPTGGLLQAMHEALRAP